MYIYVYIYIYEILPTPKRYPHHRCFNIYGNLNAPLLEIASSGFFPPYDNTLTKRLETKVERKL